MSVCFPSSDPQILLGSIQILVRFCTQILVREKKVNKKALLYVEKTQFYYGWKYFRRNSF